MVSMAAVSSQGRQKDLHLIGMACKSAEQLLSTVLLLRHQAWSTEDSIIDIISFQGPMIFVFASTFLLDFREK